jgi:hypothetical protein
MPTVFVDSKYRYYFFSNEETRRHVHVSSSGHEAKIWVEPEIAVAKNVGFSQVELNEILKTVAKRKDEINDAWNKHFKC